MQYIICLYCSVISLPDRNGHMVYNGKGGWMALIKGVRQDIGVYLCKLSVADNTGKTSEMKADVTLIC